MKNYKKLIKLLFLSSLLFTISCTSTTSGSGKKNKYTDKEEYFVLRGENYSQIKQYPEAIKEFQQAYAKNNSNVMTLLGLGFAYGELGQNDKAMEYYKKALIIEPTNVIALKNMAFLHYKKKELVTAQSYLDKLPKNLDDVFIYRLQSYIFIENKMYKEAYPSLAKSLLSTSYFDEELYTKSVETLRALSETDRLYAFLDKAYTRFKNNKYYILFFSSTLNKNMTELHKSEKVLKRYMAENFKDDQLVIALADNNYRQGKYKEASDILTLVAPKSHYSKDYLNIKNKIYDKTKIKSKTKK